MLVELLLNILSGIVLFLLNFIPNALQLPDWGSHLYHFVARGLAFFPMDVMEVVISNFVFWTTAEFAFYTKNWIYTKIRG